MRKINSFLKAGFAASLLFATVSASAVTLQKGSTYKFSCDYEVVDATAAADLLGGEFEFTLTSTTPLDIQFSNFVSTKYNGTHSSQSGNTIQLWPTFVPNQFPVSGLALSNAAGDYPFGYYDASKGGWTSDIYVNVTIGDDGNLSIPDFTVVSYNTGESEDEDATEPVGDRTVSTVAKYSNCKIELLSGGVEEETGGGDTGETDRSFTGTYTFEGTCAEYTNGSYVAETGTFTLVINEGNEPAKLLGYNLSGPLSSGYDTHTVKGDTWTLGNGCLALPGGYDSETGEMLLYGYVLGGPNTDSYSNPRGFTITVDDSGNYSITDFTVWKVTTDNGEMSTATGYELVYAWTDMTCTEYSESTTPGGNTGVSPFAGTYTGVVDVIDYTNDSFGVEKFDQPFSMEINANNELVSLCGYTPVNTITGTVSETETAGTWSFNWDANTLVKDEAGNSYLLNTNMSWDYEESGVITLYLENGSYRMGAFSIWKEDNSDILYYYQSAKGLDFDKLEVPHESSDFVGTYTGEVDVIDYTDDSFGVEKFDQPFSMEINEKDELVSICGYTPVNTITGTVSETETATTWSFNWDANTLVKDAAGNTYLLNTNMSWDYEESGVITLYNENGTFRMGAFSIWKDDNSDILYYYQSAKGLNFTPNTSVGIDTIAPTVNNGKVEFFNLQGVKVNNPSNGIFIRVQGNKSSKVIVK